MAGRDGLKLARSLEKDTYKLEAHHRHLKFTHRALDNRWFPKSLRSNLPVKHKVFRDIMERASNQCMSARISICHERINFIKKRIHTTTQELSTILPESTFNSFHGFLKQRASCVRNTINQRHEKKLDQMRKDYTRTLIVPTGWLICQKSPLPSLNAHYSRKVQSFPSPLPVYHIKTLSLRLKLRYESSLTKRKILSSRTLPAF